MSEINDKTDSAHAFLKQLSPRDFLGFGKEHVGYVKSITIDEVSGHGVFSADGELLQMVNSEDMALKVLHSFDLDQMAIH